MPKRADVSGICAITPSGMCPFNLFSLNPDSGISIGAALGRSSIPSLANVKGPAIPSACKPLDNCHASKAASVLGPNLPIGSTPNFS